MERADDPRFRVLAQDGVQPFGLLWYFCVAVEDDESSILVFKRVARFLEPFRAVFGQGELGAPMVGELGFPLE